jgi:hypothetical protein
MREETKILLAVGSAVVIALIGFWTYGILGGVMGFIITLLIIGLFSIWGKE